MRTATKNGMNGVATNRLNGKLSTVERKTVHVEIPQLTMGEMKLTLIGDRPLLVNNKLNVAEEISEKYGCKTGKSGHVVKEQVSDDMKYARAFYVMPDSKHPAPSPKGSYGVPTSGIKKCACSGIRATGITDNTTIGLLGKSFFVMEDAGGLCRLKFGRLEHDVRMVNVGSGQKTVPQMRHRPIFFDWKIDIRIKFNLKILSESQIVNIFMHAGQFVGLCELRAEKKQGECGGFVVECNG